MKIISKSYLVYRITFLCKLTYVLLSKINLGPVLFTQYVNNDQQTCYSLTRLDIYIYIILFYSILLLNSQFHSSVKKSLPLVWISEFGHINIVSGQISWIIHLIFNVRTGTTIYNLNMRGFRCHLLLVVCFSRPKTVRYAAWHYKLALLITLFECILIIISTLACSSNTFTVYCTSLRIVSYKIGIYICYILAHSQKIACFHVANLLFLRF